MTTVWTNEYWNASGDAVQVNWTLRKWACVCGLALADILAFATTYALARAGHQVPTFVLFSNADPGRFSAPIDVFALLAVIFVFARYISGDYTRRQLFWDGTKHTTLALLVASLPDVLMGLAALHIYSLAAIICSWILLLFLIPLLRQGARIFLTRIGSWQRPTTLIGTGRRAASVYDALNHSLSLGFDVRWLVAEESHKADVPASMRHLPPTYYADPAKLAQTMHDAGCRQAVITAEDFQSTQLTEICQRLLEIDIPVAVVPKLTRLPMAGVTTNYFFGRDILLLQVRSNVQRLPWRFVKRSFDIVVSILLMILFLPAFVAITIAIKRSGPGKITYSQERVGRYGAAFNCIKFRTMVTDADEFLQRWRLENPALYDEYLKSYKLKDDPRITSVGKWLRKTSLDELPQLVNVLRGEMSLVGPRPVTQFELDEYYGPAAQVYMRARPGITGLWQVSGRSETTYEQRVILDEWYILNWSFWYDIVILIQTAWAVLAGKGAF